MFRVTLLCIWVLVAVATSTAGTGYYLIPIQDRPFSEAHVLFASSGVLGHGYGIFGAGFMLLGVLAYSARKRMKALARVGKLKHWLEFHIFLCTLGPFLVVLHSAFRVGGLVAIAFWSMVLVVASGAFGRHLYARIPKTLQGNFLTLEAIAENQAKAVDELRKRAPLDGSVLPLVSHGSRPEEPNSLLHALVLGARWDFHRKRLRRALKQRLRTVEAPEALKRDVLRLAAEEARLGGQVALLQPFRRLFSYWHVFHLPLAIVMFLILAVHITVAILFGYAWVL